MRDYELLTDDEKDFVDLMFSRDFYNRAKASLGYTLLGNDVVEHAVDAVSALLIESARNAGYMRYPLIRKGTKEELQYVLSKNQVQKSHQ